MSSQIQITGETKVKSLTGVLVGTSGVVSSLNIDGSLGIPQLDVNGKILVSQLPNSVMEYKGTWSAATNTPTLVNGTGNQGDVYLCNVAGTVNFGAGAIAFFVGDQVIYSGSIWQRASGATGTVTSVAVTETGDSLNITGSPITTSGTINIGFNGTNLQYVNGAGNLTTFPTLITSIGLSMPSAFSVANSPLTANGTIAVTGAGVASQYIRGDGTLANFPTSGGGGSSVAYYFNSSVSQGTLGGVAYRELSKVPIIGAGTDITIATNGYIANYITDAGDPSLLEIPAGNWNFEMFFSASSGGGSPSFYVELYKYDGTTFTLISSSSATPEGITNGTAIDLYTTALAVPLTTLTLTDRLAIRVYVNNSGRTITLHTENSHLCEVITTFSTGIAALNGLTAQVQYFATGTSGTDFNISSTTATHTFNIPSASATNRGLITTGSQTIAGDKAFTGINSFDYGINYKTGASLANVSGYISQAYATSGTGAGSTLSLKISDGNSVKAINLDFVGSPATYTYTFPNFSGTVALLEGTQTFTGLKTFGDSIQAGYGISLYNGIGTGALVSATYTGFYASKSGTYTNITFAHDGAPYFSRLKLLNNATYDYTFPAASGTIALTSDLGSYLPLAGGIMTGSILLNNNLTISGQLFGTSSYASMLAMSPSDKVLIDNSGRGVIFGGTIGQGAYTYTFPAATGTIAILEAGTQTFTGTVNVLGSLGTKFGISIEKGNTPSPLSFNDIFIYASSGATSIINFANSSYRTSFSFPTSNQTFTFPAATGTVALTSDITSAISGTTNYHAKFTGTNTIGNSLIWDNGTNVGIGNTNTSYTLDVSGTGRFTGALTGTSATFSGVTQIGAAATGFLRMTPGTTTQSGYYEIFKGDGTTRLGYMGFSNTNYNFSAENSANFIFNGGNLAIGGSTFTFAAAGRTNLVLNGSTDSLFEFQNGGSASAYLYSNTDGLEINSVGSKFLQFVTNATIRMRITSTGNVGIGTSSPVAALDIDKAEGLMMRVKRTGVDGEFQMYQGPNVVYLDSSAASGNLAFATVGTERMRITSGGNVLINNTSSVGSKLIVKADGTSNAGYACIFWDSTLNDLFYLRNDGLVATGTRTFSPYNYAASGRAMIVDASGFVGYLVSTRESKANIKSIENVDFINQLNPVSFNYRKKDNKTNEFTDELYENTTYGFIADEVEKVNKDLVFYNEDGTLAGVEYNNMIAILTKAVQELKAEIDILKNK